MLTDNDKKLLNARGISEQTVSDQLARFKIGFPYLKLAGSATVGNGILQLDAQAELVAEQRWERYLAEGGSVTKFVPASGAASRMFKALLAFVNSDAEEPVEGSDVAQLIDRIFDLPFSDELDQTLQRLHNETLAEMLRTKRYKEIVAAVVGKEGMNYGQLPKGLLSFHRYSPAEVRTPLEEQMVEGAQTAAAEGNVNLHFTVSGAHRDLFEKKIESVRPGMEEKFGVKYNIGLSEQKASTDTIAADMDGNTFRDSNGNLVFRPGGHGALIANLGEIDSAVVFIKNIDNIVPDSEREATIRYKKILAGLLIEAHDTVDEYLRKLRSGVPSRDELVRMTDFLENVLCTHKAGVRDLSDSELASYLVSKFDRPLRVCGMVVNEGEPGGGPYIAYNSDGSYSPQILESTQINTCDERSVSLMAGATHFNPVDLVCYIRDIDDKPYDLTKYVDHETGFISSKSYEGRDLQALELPGLWNGAMSDWSTIFVEVPAATFNPVKTVNDLLRPVHQADKK